MRVTCEITTPEQLISFLAKMHFDVDLCEKAMQAQLRGNGQPIYVMYDSDTRRILELRDSDKNVLVSKPEAQTERRVLRKLVRTNVSVG